MKLFFLFAVIFFITNCSNPKKVLICGDHTCVNKSEAEQYFEENLTIEIKIIDKKTKNRIGLVELNMSENQTGEREISVASKQKTTEELKTLSNKEIIKIKETVRNKNKEKNITKKISKNKKITENKKNKRKINTKKSINHNKVVLKKNNNVDIYVNKKHKDMMDVCTILEKCSIDEISKYLIKQGKKKSYPNINTRQ